MPAGDQRGLGTTQALVDFHCGGKAGAALLYRFEEIFVIAARCAVAQQHVGRQAMLRL